MSCAGVETNEIAAAAATRATARILILCYPPGPDPPRGSSPLRTILPPPGGPHIHARTRPVFGLSAFCPLQLMVGPNQVHLF